MKIHEYKRNGFWHYQTDIGEFKCLLRHSMKSIKKSLNAKSLSVTVEIGTGILYGPMRWTKRDNKPNYKL